MKNLLHIAETIMIVIVYSYIQCRGRHLRVHRANGCIFVASIEDKTILQVRFDISRTSALSLSELLSPILLSAVSGI